MTDREILDELKQIQAEAQDALQRENKAALDKALADYDSKFDKVARQLESVEAAIKTAAVLPGGSADDSKRKAFEAFIRRGEVRDELVAGTDANGGYLVPEAQATEIIKLASNGNPMRELATVKTISGDSYPFLVRSTGAGASWTTETGTRSATGTPTYAERRITPFEIYANPPISQQLLEDAA